MSSRRTAVVIPSYNHERFIAQALDSALAQDPPPDRVIVIDDGSTDGTPGVLARYSARPGVEVVAQTNAGAHNAINRGVRMAADDCGYVAVLNSDDAYEPGRLAACRELLERQPGLSVVCTAINLMGDDGDPLAADHPRARWFRAAWSPGTMGSASLPEWLGIANFPATTSNLFARTSYARDNPFRAYRYCHDYFFFARSALEGQLAVLPDPLVRYRVHGSNTMNTEPVKLVRELVKMQLELYRGCGYAVAVQSELRERFQEFARASWQNVSAFDAGFFQSLVARLCSTAREDEFQEVLVVLGESDARELFDYPNKALVNNFDGTAPLGAGVGLAGKYEQLRTEHRALKSQHAALRDLAKVRQKLLSSKRAALGLLIGRCRGAATDSGQTPEEKLANVREGIASSKWLRGWKF